MSRHLRDLAERHIKKASQLLQKNKHEDALKELEIAKILAQQAKANDIFLNIQTDIGHLMQVLNKFEESLEIYIKTLIIIEKILSKDPNNELYLSNYQGNLDAINTLGDFFHSIGNFLQAKRCHELNLSIYLKLLDKDPENIEYQLNVAVTLNNLGNLLSDIGQMEEAENRYENALKIHEKLLQTYSKNVIYQSNVGTTLNNLGFLLLEMGRFEEAKQRFEESFKILKNLYEMDPKNIIYQSKLAMITNNIGNVFAYTGHPEEAKNRYEEALDLREKILYSDPKDASYYSAVAQSLNNLGSILTNLGYHEEAKKRLENSLDMRKKIVETYPESACYQLDVVNTLNNLGSLLASMGLNKEAKSTLESAVYLMQKILEKDLKNVNYQSKLVSLSTSLGSVLEDLGCLKEAKEKLENSLDLMRKIVEIYPETNNYQLKLATILNSLGNLFSNIERFEDARDRFEEALGIYKKLLEIDPENITYQLRVGVIINNLGNLFFRMGNIEEAKAKYIKALKICETLLKISPKNALCQSYIGDILHSLGSLFSDNGRVEDARQSYEKALEIRKNLLEKDPKNLSYQSAVATTFNNLGNLLWTMGWIEEAKQGYEKALEIRENLLEKDPKNLSYQSAAATTLNDLGISLYAMGCIEDAKQSYEKALEIRKNLLEKDPKNLSYQSAVATTLNNLGILYSYLQRIEDAGQSYEKALKIYEKLLKTNSGNVSYQSYVGTTLINLGFLLNKMGLNEEAKQRYERALEIYEKLLETDPENIMYQSDLGTTLNNFGNLLFGMGLIEEAKEKYERALEILKEPMQFLTIGKKSNSIIRLIELNLKRAENESNLLNKVKYLQETVYLCREYRDFFIKYELGHEKKLLTSVGISSYVDLSMINVRFERDSEKRAKQYETALQAVEKLSELEDQTISKLYSSAACYLRGRKLVNEALSSRKPEIQLLKQAIEQFKNAKETYDKANVCFCIYTGLLNILEKVETYDNIDILKLKELIQEVIKSFPENVNSNIIVAFENIAQIFEEKDFKARKELIKDLDEKIGEIEHNALEKIFEYVHGKIKEYFDEPFNLKIIYDKWKLKVIIYDPEKIKGKLTVKVRDKILFDRALSKEEIKKSFLEINYLDIGYLPQGEDKISFMTVGQKKPVFETVNYFEKITNDHEIRVLQYDCSDQISIGKEPIIAVVQLKYHIYKENTIIKISIDDKFHKKDMTILEYLKNRANIIVFPEFSIPFDYLVEIQKFADDNRILIFAGSHYVIEKNLGAYGNLFSREFTDEDLMKNICPIVIPNSKIIHNEKYLGASIERPSFFEEGMEIGKINNILKIREGLSIGVMICYEFLNTEYRHRLVPVCDIILVPQTNSETKSFYDDAWNDIDRPICGGTKHFIIANGIFTFGNEEKVQGGSTGTVSTLNKHLNRRRKEGIVVPINGILEQFILITKINTNYFPGQDTQNAQEAVTNRLTQIFDETELLKSYTDNKGLKPNGKDFIKLLRDIETCDSKTELKHILENAQKEIYEAEFHGKVKKISLIESYSPLMNKRIQNMDNLSLEKIKNRCRCLLISDT